MHVLALLYKCLCLRAMLFGDEAETVESCFKCRGGFPRNVSALYPNKAGEYMTYEEMIPRMVPKFNLRCLKSF